MLGVSGLVDVDGSPLPLCRCPRESPFTFSVPSPNLAPVPFACLSHNLSSCPSGDPGDAICVGTPEEFPAVFQPADPSAFGRSGITNMILLRENLVLGAIRVRVRRSGGGTCSGSVAQRDCYHRSKVLTSDEWGDVSFSAAKVGAGSLN